MRHIYAGMLALACVGAQAATYEFSLTNPSLTLIDLTPGDQFAPSYTVDTGDVLGFLTPVDIHAKGNHFENNTVFPPSTGPTFGQIAGTLGPGTELIWRATGHLKISVIDTDGVWDFDRIQINTAFYSADRYPFTQEFNIYLGGYGGTYQRLTKEYNFNMELRVSNAENSSQSYVMGWVNPYEFDSWNIPRPVTSVPEPETYALLLAGLGIVGAVVRRRAKARALYS